MTTYKYTQNWFLVSEIRQKLLRFINGTQTHKILEIGCFEGLSSVFFADKLLTQPASRLVCVDPFLKINNNDHMLFLQKNEEANFDYNITHCQNKEKIKVNKITSDEFFETNNEKFDLIYIDGCHQPDYIMRDMENSFKALEINGIMWMDDYCGGNGITIKNTMDSFLKKYKGQYKIIHQQYQLAIMKC